jgi:hypothetical protein
MMRKFLRIFLVEEEGVYSGFLDENKSTPDNPLDKKDCGLFDTSLLSIRDRAAVPQYSLKRYLRGDRLVDVIFGTPRTRSSILEDMYRRGDMGSMMDDPTDFGAGDGYIQLMLWRNNKRFDQLWDTCGRYFRGAARLARKKKDK